MRKVIGWTILVALFPFIVFGALVKLAVDGGIAAAELVQRYLGED